MEEADELLAKVREYLPPEKVSLVEEAYEFAAKCHEGQKRKSGDPFIVHPLDTAMTVANLQMDASAVAAALLHDVQEDSNVKNEELVKRFGQEVAKLVDGASKLDKVAWYPGQERQSDDGLQAENLRKMFLAMAEDIRVVIIKLADRLHNMRTLDALSPEKQVRIAQETMDIYAPLAGRLGIWQIRWELEDLSFRHLQPEAYREISRLLATKRTAREKYIARVEKILGEELERQGIKAEVKGRAKHIYSIYEKMHRYSEDQKGFGEIYDIMAMRVLVDTVADCYNALGAVHNLWRPLPGQFDDYIANPKDNLYQSLHTAVLGPDARPLEVQIRTHEMHRVAEYGVAAHWRYKEGRKRDPVYEERMSWLRQLLEWHREMAAADEFVESVKTDLFRDQVFVYTPKGDLKDLPAGATPLDFAYRIHTDLGNRCIGAKVNGRLVPLTYRLQNGDVVEVLSGKSSRGPSRDWLNVNLGYLRTSHSREKVRQWFKRQERDENIERGRETLDRELGKLGLALGEVQAELMRSLGFEEFDDLLAAIGYGGVSTHQLSNRLAPFLPKDETPQTTSTLPPGPVYTTKSVQVLGTGDLLTRIAQCCNPVPGDKIIGYVTRSRGVTVHRNDCPNILNEDEPHRLVDVEWGRSGRLYSVAVRIEAWDRVGLLRDISTVAAEDRVNMAGVATTEHGDGTVTVSLTLETDGVEQLTRLLGKLEGVRGVLSADRVHQRTQAIGS